LPVTRLDLRAFERLVSESAGFVTSSPTSRVSAASPFSPFALLRSTSAGPHGLRSSSEFWFHCPGRGLPTASLGIRPGCAVAADIAAVATFTLPDLPPLHRPRPRRPLPRRHCCRRFGLEVPTSKSRSDLTVSHGLAGLLRRSPRSRGTLRCCQRRIHGLVASRYRSWGSLRFASSSGWLRHPTPAILRWSVCSRSRERRVLAALFVPFGGFPPSAAVSCHHDRCLPGVRFPRSPDRFVATVTGFDVRVMTT
jgi:hypothetical protein